MVDRSECILVDIEDIAYNKFTRSRVMHPSHIPNVGDHMFIEGERFKVEYKSFSYDEYDDDHMSLRKVYIKLTNPE